MYMVGEGFKSADCKDNDQLISWNVTGPQGPQGLQGIPGIAGQTGAQGIQGPAGANGLTGADGQAGATGSQGPSGTSGAQGPAGPQGLAGVAGAPGAGGIDKSRLYTKLASTTTPPASFIAQEIVAYCDDANDVLLSGGYLRDTTLQILRNYSVESSSGISGWAVRAHPSGAEAQFLSSANCLRVD